MFNKTALKEANLIWLRGLLFNHEDYSADNFYTSGDWAEKMEYPGMVVSIARENVVINGSNGLLSYDPMSEDRIYLYISDFTIVVEIYSTNDEEVESIASYLMSQMRETYTLPKSTDISISRTFDDIVKDKATPRENNFMKGWVSTVYYDIRVNMTKTIEGEFHDWFPTVREVSGD